MKPSAAFALGLWTGAVLVAAIGAYNLRVWKLVRTEIPPEITAELERKSEQIKGLQQEQARLATEEQRLRETVAELKNNLDTRSAIELRRQAREARMRAASPAESPAEPAVEPWIARAVASGDATVLPRLEPMALQNDQTALEAIALLADRDDADTLTRVWNADSLTWPSRLKATRYLAATVEINPRGEELVRLLLTSGTTDGRVIYAVADGLANPSFPSSLVQEGAVTAPPRFRPDFNLRLRLLDVGRTAVTDERTRAQLDRKRDELLTRWAQAEQAPQ